MYKRQTYGKGNNKATLINDISDFDGITSEYIIVARKDIEVKENVISELSRYIQQSDVGVVGAVIVKNYKKMCIRDSIYPVELKGQKLK